MNYFNIKNRQDYLNEAGKKYITNSKGVKWYFDTRKKLEELAKLLGKDLSLNLVKNYSEKPNGQAGKGKGFILKKYVLSGFIPQDLKKEVGKSVFLKLTFYKSNSDLYFAIDCDTNFSDKTNKYNKIRQKLNKETHKSWKVDANFPTSYNELVNLISEDFKRNVEVIKKYVSKHIEVTKESEISNKIKFNTMPLNQILYGPPGTGKTYYLLENVIPKYTKNTSTKTKEIIEAEIISKLPWWKVFALILMEVNKLSVPEIKKHVYTKYKLEASNTNSLNQTVWGQLSSHAVGDSKTVEYKARQGAPIFDKHENSEWFIPNKNHPVIQELEELKEEMKTIAPMNAKPNDNFKFITFHQSTSYETFVEGIMPVFENESADSEGQITYEIKKGSFYLACEEAAKLAGFFGLNDCLKKTKQERIDKFKNAKPYYLLIDEINRGNVSAILGELITLIEEDKRLTKNEIILDLPYSNRKFGVPPNLYIIGTMNTADRSIEALDTALRRRFSFTEMLPLYDIDESTATLKYEFASTTGSEILKTINQRIEKLLDRDHLIGHSYFLLKEGEDPETKLLDSFYRNIIPLLQEYFYGDYAKIGAVLGEGFVYKVEESETIEFASGFDNEDYNEKEIYQIIDYRESQPGSKFIKPGIEFENAIQLLMNISIAVE